MNKKIPLWSREFFSRLASGQKNKMRISNKISKSIIRGLKQSLSHSKGKKVKGLITAPRSGTPKSLLDSRFRPDEIGTGGNDK
jgi:hypothetical protein